MRLHAQLLRQSLPAWSMAEQPQKRVALVVTDAAASQLAQLEMQEECQTHYRKLTGVQWLGMWWQPGRWIWMWPMASCRATSWASTSSQATPCASR